MTIELLKFCKAILSQQEESNLPMLVDFHLPQDLDALCDKLKQIPRWSKVPLASLKTSVEKLTRQEMLNVAPPKGALEPPGGKEDPTLGKRAPVSPADRQAAGPGGAQAPLASDTDVGFVRSSWSEASYQGTSTDQVYPSIGNQGHGCGSEPSSRGSEDFRTQS